MTHRHVPARTTHTVELEQIEQLNERLRARGQPRHPGQPHGLDTPSDAHLLTAQALGLAGETATVAHAQWSGDLTPAGSPHAQALPAGAVLDHITADGPPSFPYIWGHFEPEPDSHTGELLLAPLHTEALIQLSAAFGLRQRWGF